MLRQALVVDDHVAVRNGVAQILRDEFPEMTVGTADSAQTSLDRLGAEHFDLVILDLSLPGRGGLEIIRQMKDLSPHSAILVYTMFPEQQFGVRALRAGADGYLTKDRPEAELLEAVRRLASGKRYITAELAESLADHVSEPSGQHLHTLLSDREFQILRLLGAGKRPTDIAAELNLSIKTVSTFRSRILTKLNLSSTGDLIRYAIEQGLVT